MNGQKKGGEQMTEKEREEKNERKRERERTLLPIRTYKQPAYYLLE